MLVRLQLIEPEVLEWAAASRTQGTRLGECLVHAGAISEDDLYRALSMQADLPFGAPVPADVHRPATRLLPAAAARRWRVVPYRVDLGQLYLATDEVPSEEMTRDLTRLSSLSLRFRLVRPGDLERLMAQYLPPALASG